MNRLLLVGGLIQTLFDKALHYEINHSTANIPVHAAASMNSLIQANLPVAAPPQANALQAQPHDPSQHAGLQVSRPMARNRRGRARAEAGQIQAVQPRLRTLC